MSKTVLLPIITIVLLSLTSCDLDLFDSVDCSECLSSKPNYTHVKVNVTINKENPYVPLEFYLGDIDRGLLTYRDTADASVYYIIFDVDQYYSVVAKYNNKGRIVNVVNGEKLEVNKESDSCEEVCYTIKGDVIDVRLKE